MKKSRGMILVLFAFSLVSAFLLVSCMPVREDVEKDVQETITDSTETEKGVVAQAVDSGVVVADEYISDEESSNNNEALAGQATLTASAARRLNACMTTFKKKDDLYRAVSSQYPNKNKVRLYASTDGKRHLKIINDLKSSSTGFGTYWNTVVQVNHVGALGTLPSLGDPFCVNGEPTPQTIDPGYWAIYDFPETHNKGSYKFSLSMGAYVPNLFIVNGCGTGLTDNLISDLNYDEFGVEVFDSSGVTLDCATYSQPQCDLWRIDQLETDCAMNNIYKGFDHIVLNHCEGMTYEIRLSSLLPDNTRMTAEPPLCNVYAEAAR